MNKALLGVMFLLSLLLFGCSLFTDKPSDNQIKRNVEQYIKTNYKQLKINSIEIRGILFTKDKNTLGKAADAIIDVKLEYITDVKSRPNPTLAEIFKGDKGLTDGDWLNIDKSHKKGELLSMMVHQKYVRADRAWLSLKIKREEVRVD